MEKTKIWSKNKRLASDYDNIFFCCLFVVFFFLDLLCVIIAKNNIVCQNKIVRLKIMGKMSKNPIDREEVQIKYDTLTLYNNACL